MGAGFCFLISQGAVQRAPLGLFIIAASWISYFKWGQIKSKDCCWVFADSPWNNIRKPSYFLAWKSGTLTAPGIYKVALILQQDTDLLRFARRRRNLLGKQERDFPCPAAITGLYLKPSWPQSSSTLNTWLFPNLWSVGPPNSCCASGLVLHPPQHIPTSPKQRDPHE